MLMEMPRALYDEMIAHVRAARPEEACGLIAGQGERAVALYPVENRLHSPVEYEMAPLAQIEAMLDMEAQGWEMLGIYHSHPHSPAWPSSTDIDRSYYPEAQYVIVSLQQPDKPDVRAFSLGDRTVRELDFRVFDPDGE
jgi:proteasome lid subunit RPN8/RPN11